MIELWTLDLLHWAMVGESWTVRTLPQGLHPARCRSLQIMMVSDMRFALSETMIVMYDYMNSTRSYFSVIE